VYDNRLSKAILSIILVVVIIGLATAFLEKAPPTERKSPPPSATNSVIHPIGINTVLNLMGKLKYDAQRPMMRLLTLIGGR
jgi:hypothetical protein